MRPVHVQTKREIQAILASEGVRPDRRLGQHFLVDGNLMRKLVAGAEVAAGDTVLEVGGGTGGLTDLLADAARRVIVVEVDGILGPCLAQRFGDRPHVVVLQRDVLANKSTIAPEVLAALDGNPPEEGRFLFVANLPYHVATPLILNLLVDQPRVARFCFAIQREVADRLVASAGHKTFGPPAIAVQTTCDARRLATLPPRAFWPPPKVDSAMLRLDRKAHPFERDGAMRRFMAFVHACFAHRRKTLEFNLGRYLSADAIGEVAGRVDVSKRAEAIDLHTWIELGVQLGDHLAPRLPG